MSNLSRKKTIGFFDSGVGGISVLKEAIKKFGKGRYIYIGDTARMPYGVRTEEEVSAFTLQCIEYISDDVDRVIIACNTATCYGLEDAKAKFDFDILGMVEPVCKYIVKNTKNKKVALIATDGTCKSKVYDKTFEKLDKQIQLKSVGAMGIHAAIEDGHMDGEKIEGIISDYLKKFDGYDYDTLILGCTHFPLAQKAFERVLKFRGITAKIVDPAVMVVQELKEKMGDFDTNEKKIALYCTGDVEKFKENVNKAIDLEGYDVEFKKVKVD